ncbi:hypothetical protein BGZ83_009383 [Gryganskiella cystojenkinii]|nr:hypothetical protein BGZ83_009383 [Gryganskiella cystojenkinii]
MTPTMFASNIVKRVSTAGVRTAMVARPTVSATTALSTSWTRIAVRNKSTSASPINPTAKPAASSSSSTNTNSAQPKEEGFLTMIFKGQSKLTIATVIIAACAADASFTYLTLFHNREEGKVMKEDTFYHRLFSKLGFDLNKVEDVESRPKEE